MSLWRSILISLFIWPLYTLFGLISYLLGFLLVPVALTFKAYSTKYTIFGNFKILYNWPIMRLFSNLEDGDLGPDYYYPNRPNIVRGFMWFCRNPNSGFRWLPILSVKIKPNKIRYIGSLGYVGDANPIKYEAKEKNWFYVWHGPYSCLWWQFKIGSELWRFWIGNGKLYPADMIPQNYGYRQHGTTGVIQLKRVQPGNNRN